MWNNPFIKESIYIASKSLYADLDKLFANTAEINQVKKEGLIKSFYKYLARMSNRSTPFGLFAGCAALQWGNEQDLVLNSTFERHITLDAAVDGQLASINERQHSSANYVLNNTIYLQGAQYKFIKYEIVEEDRVYEIVGLANNPILEQLISTLKKDGQSRMEIAKTLGDFDPEEALAFVDRLIQVQFLTYTGKPGIGMPFPHYLQTPWPAGLQPQLQNTLSLLAHITAATGIVDDVLRHYAKIEQNLNELLGYTPNNSFHVTRINHLKGDKLSNNIQARLLRGIKLLHNLCDFEPPERLKQFKTQFLQRYQGRSVSLLEAFDQDTGIEYGHWHNKETLLTEGLNASLGKRNDYIPYTETSLKLLKVLTTANLSNGYTFTLPENFVQDKPLLNLPYNMAAIFQVFDQGQVYMEQVSGTGSLGLLARFANADTAIAGLANTMAAQETLTNPQAIYAEIIHLPEERSANVMSHPQFWPYELQYVDHAKGSQVIGLSEIEVTLQNGVFKLFSKQKQQEIIPKLSSAYNYNRSQHPIYTFLCDIQHQTGPNGLSFNWGRLAKDFVFFPRVDTTFGLILHRATWKFTTAHLRSLITKENSNDLKQVAFEKFRLEWKIPERFFIVKGDNELLIEANNVLSVDVFIKEATKTDTELVLRECLHHEMEPIFHDTDGNKYAHQFVAPLFAIAEVKNENFKPSSSLVTRHFFPGSEWLYVKIFLNENTAQQVLITLFKLLDKRYGRLDYQKWFFIRYYEHGHHIRLRILLHSADDFQQTYFLVKSTLDPFISHQQISNIQLDTYDREIERYGASQIELAESLFDIDSRFCGHIFMLFEKNDYTEQGWLLIFWVMKDYLTLKNEDVAMQLSFAEIQLDLFLKEMDSKMVKIQIDQLFRKFGAILPDLANNYNEQLNNRRTEVEILLQNHKADWNDKFVASLIHMLVNRYFVNQQRLHECLLYGMLVKHLKSNMARAAK